MPLDLRPNIKIDPQDFAPKVNPYEQFLPNFLSGQQQGRSQRSRQMILGLMNDPELKQDPQIGPFLPFIAANPDLIEHALPAMIRAKALAQKKMGGQQMVPSIIGPTGDLRPDQPPQQPQPGLTPGMPSPGAVSGTPPPTLAPGEVRGEIPFSQYVGRMQSQENKKDSSRRFQTLLTERTAKTVTPYDSALKTLDQWEKNYKSAIAAKEVGPAVARAGGALGDISGGKKFARLFNYRRSKAQTLHTLSGSLGVGRFVYQAMLGISDALPNGTEDPQRGLELFTQARANLESRKQQAYQNLQNEMMLYRAVMMPGQPNMEMPQETPQETPDAAAFEEP